MKKIGRVLFVILIGLIGSGNVYAEDAADDGVGYSVRAMLPENQRDTGRSFFDLRMVPGQEQVIQVEISNESDEAATYEIQLNNAFTNNNVIIDYQKTENPVDETLVNPFDTIASAQNQIELPPQSQSIIDITLKMPAEEFDGMNLGGIRVSKVADEEKAENSVSVATAYVIGVILTENDTVVKPDMQLKEVTADLRGFKPQFVVNLQNPQAMNISDLTIDAQVYRADSDDVVKEAKTMDHRVAPNTTFNYFIPTDGDPMYPGDYRLNMVAEDQSGNRWEFDKEFTVTDENADRINNDAVGITVESNNRWLFIALGVLTGIILILIIYLIVNRRKKNRKDREAV